MKEKLDQFERDSKENDANNDNQSHVGDKSDVESHKSGKANKIIDPVIKENIEKQNDIQKQKE